jgi:hypothetical protein
MRVFITGIFSIRNALRGNRMRKQPQNILKTPCDALRGFLYSLPHGIARFAALRHLRCEQFKFSKPVFLSGTANPGTRNRLFFGRIDQPNKKASEIGVSEAL